MLSDGELLRQYVQDRSESAFTALVQRHINVVYRTALRRVGGNAHAADDAVQRVFTDLARKASPLQSRTSLAGWLYTSTRFAAAQIVRAEQRRRTHEQEAHTMQELESRGAADVRQLEPFLDEVMESLNERDREAVLLHFFEGLTFAETGAMLSISADACRMRVNRAIETLRAGFARRGVASTAAALAAVLSTQSAMAAPTTLAATVATQALSQAGVASATAGAKLISALKAWGLAPWGGTAAAVAVISVAVHVAHSSAPEPLATTTTEAAAGPKLKTSAAANSGPIDEVVTVQEEKQPAPIAPVRTLLPEAAATPATASSDFETLTAAEQRVLAILWTLERERPVAPGTVRSLRFGALAPGLPARDLLVAKGWAALNPLGGIHLTPAGRAFCREHADEIAQLAESIDFSRIHSGNSGG